MTILYRGKPDPNAPQTTYSPPAPLFPLKPFTDHSMSDALGDSDYVGLDKYNPPPPEYTNRQLLTREAATAGKEDVPAYPGTPTDPGSFQTATEGLELGDDFLRAIYGDDQMPVRPETAMVPARRDYNAVGGKDTFEQATKVQPEKAAEGVAEEGRARADAGKELASFYASERDREVQQLGVMNEQRLRDQAEYEARVRKLDEASDAIARHRLDQGRFWKNPGNIIAALGAAVMQLGTNEPIGVKLINGAIERDLMVQRAEHDFLQADKQGLETNVALFRQLAGDKQAGDMLHEAKMREAAALKIQEIGAQLQSKEALAHAKTIQAQLMQSAYQLRMAAHAQLIYRAPTVQTKAMRDAMMAGEVVPFGKVDPATGAPVQEGSQLPPGMVDENWGSPRPPPAAKAAGGMVRQVQEFQRSGSGGRDPVQEFFNGGVRAKDEVTEEAKFAYVAKRVEERIGVQGARGRMMMWRNDVRRRAMQQGHLRGTPSYYKFLDGERIQAMKDAAEPAKSLASGQLLPSFSSIRQLQGTLSQLESEFKGDLNKIDKELGQDWKAVYGADLERRLVRAKEVLGWSDDSVEAARRFHQTFQHANSQYTRALAGGAVTTTEEKRIWNEVQNSGSFASIKHWAELASENQGAQLTNAVQTSPNIVGQYLFMIQMGLSQRGLPRRGIPAGNK